MKIVLFAIGSDILRINEHRFVYPFVRSVLTKSDFIFCASSLIEDRVKSICSDTSKVKIVPSIIHFEDFESYNGPKTYDLVTVGALDANKNQKLLLDACKLLPRSIRILIIGAGPMEDTLRTMSERHNLNVVFAGILPHKAVLEELQKARIYVHTSKTEGLPVAVLEAMFSELPVILIRSLYVNDIKNRYGFAVVVARDSAADLSRKIKEMLKRCEKERRFISLNKKRVVELYEDASSEIGRVLRELGR